MPITLERLPNEPILVATYTGHITLEDIRGLYRATAELIGDEPGTFHRISDTRGATSDFMEMLKTVQTVTQEMAGSSLDQRIQVTFVGTTSWIRFLREAFAKRGVLTSAFEDLESALESVRYRVVTETSERQKVEVQTKAK
jgi:hypothetical protein